MPEVQGQRAWSFGDWARRNLLFDDRMQGLTMSTAPRVTAKSPLSAFFLLSSLARIPSQFSKKSGKLDIWDSLMGLLGNILGRYSDFSNIITPQLSGPVALPST